jgi:hypothetical protein
VIQYVAKFCCDHVRERESVSSERHIVLSHVEGGAEEGRFRGQSPWVVQELQRSMKGALRCTAHPAALITVRTDCEVSGYQLPLPLCTREGRANS